MTRYAISLALFFSLFCQGMTASAACWNVQYRDGRTLEVPEVWQLKSRLNNNAELIGEMDGERRTVAMDSLQVIRFSERSTGWRSLLSGGEINAELELRGGSQVQLKTSMPLIYADGRKNRQLPLQDLASVTRCVKGTETLSEQADDPETLIDVPLTPAPSGPHPARVYMMNSDILGGICRTNELIIKTDYALLSIETAKIQTLQRMKDDVEKVTVSYSGNNRVTGRWIDSEIQLEISPGQVINLETGLIQSIGFSHRSNL